MIDHKLITGCKSNDKKAQIELYRKYNQGMYNVAFRLLQNTEDAEDVIQESFLSAYKNIHQFKAEVTFGAWLKKIVINKTINYLKRNQLAIVEIDEEHSSYIEVEQDNWKPNEDMISNDIKNAIKQLPEKYRYVVMLYFIEGFDHLEVSEILNITGIVLY